jgi:hypothetical protein
MNITEQKGEVVTGVMVVMMACMMIGMFFMHGGHGSHGGHGAGNGNEQKQHAYSDHSHMHDSAAVKDSAPAEDGKK